MLINEQIIEKHIKLSMAKRERGVRRGGRDRDGGSKPENFG